MLDNIMIIDRKIIDLYGMYKAIASLDYVIIKEDCGSYTFYKNRSGKTFHKFMTYDEMCAAIHEIKAEKV